MWRALLIFAFPTFLNRNTTLCVFVPLCNKKSLFTSKKCESKLLSPFLRYGKYCGLLYSRCPEERPYDSLDACCMKHDACIQAKNNDYLSQKCSQNLLNCMTNFKNSRGRTFKGSKCEVEDVDVLSIVMEAALLAGRYLHKP
ncbi:hypothetical protein ACJRO7_013606 [Eucalyptus globulus]|uniref:Phospholipase A(2) n=1 Tax=Eucalyptus globulus TaxID=34317 RepID=A0ABD3KXA6_EUCGL